MSKPNIIYKRKMDLLKKSILMGNSLDYGFTLAEALMAAAFSFLVIVGAAFGVTTMMKQNATLEARSQRRMELDRALNYIADEIKQANDVQIVKSGSTFPGSGTGVLLLTIPVPVPPPLPDPLDPTKIDPTKIAPTKRILIPTQRVYFIRLSTDIWVGPNTINRFCSIPKSDKINIDNQKYKDDNYFPSFCSTGTTISNPVAVGEVDADNVLVDGIVVPNNDELTRIKNDCKTDTTKPNTNAAFQGDQGFYACVYTTTICKNGSSDLSGCPDPKDQDKLYRVDLYLYGRLQKLKYVTGNQMDDPTLENLALTTTVFARGTP